MLGSIGYHRRYEKICVSKFPRWQGHRTTPKRKTEQKPNKSKEKEKGQNPGCYIVFQWDSWLFLDSVRTCETLGIEKDGVERRPRLVTGRGVPSAVRTLIGESRGRREDNTEESEDIWKEAPESKTHEEEEARPAALLFQWDSWIFLDSVTH